MQTLTFKNKSVFSITIVNRMSSVNSRANTGDCMYVICQTRKTVFNHISEQRQEARGTQRSIFDELRNVANVVKLLSVSYINSIETKTKEKTEK